MTSSTHSQSHPTGSDDEVNEWEMAKQMTMGNTLKNVVKALSRNNTTSRNNELSRKNTSAKRVCANESCSNEFVPRAYNHKFCSNDCRAKAHGFNDENHVKKQMIRKRANL